MSVETLTLSKSCRGCGKGATKLGTVDVVGFSINAAGGGTGNTGWAETVRVELAGAATGNGGGIKLTAWPEGNTMQSEVWVEAGGRDGIGDTEATPVCVIASLRRLITSSATAKSRGV